MPKTWNSQKYQNLLNMFNPISKNVGYDIIEASNDQIIPVSKLTDDNLKIIIFDDFFCEKNQKPLIDHFIRGRHENCTVIYLSQSYYKTPKDITLNCSHFCVNDFPNTNEKSHICRENNTPKEAYEKATQDPYCFVYIDKPRTFTTKKLS